jgi:hypothetical protein
MRNTCLQAVLRALSKIQLTTGNYRLTVRARQMYEGEIVSVVGGVRMLSAQAGTC